MNPEQFERLEALHGEAAAMDPGERTSFIDQRCAGDESCAVLWAEGKSEEARQVLKGIIADQVKLRARFPNEFSPVFFISRYYRQLASLSSGEERRQASLHSAEAWNSRPATSFTQREEEKTSPRQSSGPRPAGPGQAAAASASHRRPL